MQFPLASFAMRLAPVIGLTAGLAFAVCAPVASPVAWAQGDQTPSIVGGESHTEAAAESAVGQGDAGRETLAEDAGHGELHGEEAKGPRPVFEPEHGTWFNLPARNIFASPEEKAHMAAAESQHAALAAKAESGAVLTPEERTELDEGVHYVSKYDFLLYTPLLWIILAVMFIGAARKATIRPQGKAASLRNTLEAALEAFQDYLIGVMGNDLARKYTPLIASFFFTILVSNWLGLVPGMLSPSAQPAIPIAMAIVGFIAVHVIAIKESGLKTWFMHFVGEPIWLAPLNFPLHIVGELIKPLSLSLRLLCNVFGEEAVVATLAALAIAFLPAWLPIPFQIPMLLLGTFFGFLQALVFSTLLAIYLAIFLEHNDDHGHGEDGHAGSHTEHAVESDGDEQIVGRPTALTVGA